MICSLLLLSVLALPQDSQRVALGGAQDLAAEGILDEELVLSIYDVQDILTNLTSSTMHDDERSKKTPEERKFERDQRRKQIVAEFVGKLQKHLDPPYLESANELNLAGMSLAKVPTTIAFTGTPQQQAWVDAFLRAHRGRDQYVTVSTNFLAGPRGAFRNPKKDSGTRFFLNEQAIGEYLGEMRAQNKVEFIVAPQVMISPGIKASISTTSEVAYIESVTMRVVEPGGIEIADPEIATFEEGVRMKIDITPVPKRAIRNPKGQWIVEAGLTMALHMRVENSAVERPIPTRIVRVSSRPDAEGIQVSTPVVTCVVLEADLMLELGTGILIGGPSSKDDQDVAILISLPTKQLMKLRSQR